VGVSNLYLLMAEEMGALGVACFLVLIIIFLASLIRTWRKGVPPRLESLLLGLLASTTAVMVGGLLDHYLFNLVYPHMSTFFWIFVGLGMSVTLVAGGRWQITGSTPPLPDANR
jgi:tellurite resistance protein TehA-like permease